MTETHDATVCPCTCHRLDEIARDVARELADREADLRRRLRRAQLDVAESTDWSALSRTSTFAELAQCRGETAR